MIEANRPSDEALCRPALLWDVLALWALEDPGAEAFIKAFGPPQAEKPDVGSTAHPLVLGAAIVVYERRGNRAAAGPLYKRISGSPWKELLSACLRAWAPSSEDVESIHAARELSRSFADREFRSHVLAKLSGIAADRNEFGLAETLLTEAIECAEGYPRLATALRFEHSNLVGTLPPFEVLASSARLPADPLVDYDWIDAGGLGGAREQLGDMLADRARSPWSTRFRVGQTPVDHVVAAEQQATWAGALWLRRELRKQTGAQILLSGTATSEQLGYGLLMWLIGGGLERQSIANFLEPQLRTTEINEVVKYLLHGEDPTGLRQHAAAEICLALWDCLPDETAVFALDRLPPDDPRFALGRDSARLWSVLGNRLLSGWEARFATLQPGARAAVAAGLSPQAIAAISAKTVSAIEDVLDEMPAGDANPWLVRAAVAERVGNADRIEPVAEIPVDHLLELASVFPARVSDADLRQAAERLAETIEKSISDAHQGAFGMGGQYAEALLGRIMLLLREPGPEYVLLLTRVASDPAMAGTDRLAALTSLGLIAGEFGLDEETAAVIRRSPVDAPQIDFLSVDPAVLEAAKLLAVHDRLTDEDVAVLFALARSRDARARQLAINAAGLAYRKSERRGLGHILVAALFDPEPLVIERSAYELKQGVPAELRLTVERRLPVLATGFPRRVRAAAVSLAGAIADDRSSKELSGVVEQSQRDKSWQVRRSAVDTRH